MRVLGWLFFLPASVLATILANRFLGFVNDFTIIGRESSTSGFLSVLCDAVIVGVVNGFVFVFVGVFIVPKYKKQIAVLLAVIINIVMIRGLVLRYSTLNSKEVFFEIVLLVALLISSSFTTFKVMNAEGENQII